MSSGRVESVSEPGQENSSHLRQQTVSNVSSPSSHSSTAVLSQIAMLSAGQPAVIPDIFRTGADNIVPSQRFSASGDFASAHFPSIYGIYGQSPGHLATMQPYSTFFTGSTESCGRGHSFTLGTTPSVSISPYAHLASYSAVLASMTSHTQHNAGHEIDRIPRLQEQRMSAPYHTSLFLPSTGPQYPNILSGPSHRGLSESNSHSPGPLGAYIFSPTSKCQDAFTPDMQRITGIKENILQGREDDTSRDAKFYRNSSSLRENKSSFSTSGHIPKVSFDTTVKEYTGGTQTTFSRNKGSLKHRILTRTPDSEKSNEFSKMTGVHELKEEPLFKRQKMSGSSSAMENHHPSPEHHSGFKQSETHATCQPSYSVVSNTEPSVAFQHYSNLPRDQPQQMSTQHDNQNCKDNNRYKKQRHSSQSSLSSSPPQPSSASCSSQETPSHLQYPSHFVKGSIIQLANGTLKHVEDLQTEDFINSAEISSDLKVDSSTVVQIEKHTEKGTAMLNFCVGEHRVQVTVEAALEHPFFVFGQGWSSCSVSRTLKRYGLDCQKLNVGDVCLSLTHKDVNVKAAELAQQKRDESLRADLQIKSETISTSKTIESQATPPQAVLSPSTTVSSSCLNSLTDAGSKSKQSDTCIVPSLSSSSSGTQKLSQKQLLTASSEILDHVKQDIGNKFCSQKLEHTLIEVGIKQEVFKDNVKSNFNSSACTQAIDSSSVKLGDEYETNRQIEVNGTDKN